MARLATLGIAAQRQGARLPNSTVQYIVRVQCEGHIWCRVQLRSNTYSINTGPRDHFRALGAQNYQNRPSQGENYQTVLFRTQYQ